MNTDTTGSRLHDIKLRAGMTITLTELKMAKKNKYGIFESKVVRSGCRGTF